MSFRSPIGIATFALLLLVAVATPEAAAASSCVATALMPCGVVCGSGSLTLIVAGSGTGTASGCGGSASCNGPCQTGYGTTPGVATCSATGTAVVVCVTTA